MLFHTLKGGAGFETWKRFDKELARELSMFFTGKLYSREVISQKQRELCAVASLTVLHRPHELRAHIHAALNVGATRQEVAEVIFQQVTYGGMPVVVDALDVFEQRAGRARRACRTRSAGRMTDLDRALDAAVDAARVAGRRSPCATTATGSTSPSSPTRRRSRRPIASRSRRSSRCSAARSRSSAFLGEEFGAKGSTERRWIIDPIDGTRNFVRRIPVWATLIALEEDGEVTAGVMHNPLTDEMYRARRGGGAFVNGERIRVSSIADLAQSQFLHAGLGLYRQAGRWEGSSGSSTPRIASAASATTWATRSWPRGRPRSTPSST